jgi:hypothetical protein
MSRHVIIPKGKASEVKHLKKISALFGLNLLLLGKKL